MIDALDGAPPQHRRRVVYARIGAIHESRDDRGLADAGGQCLELAEVLLDERRLEDEVFGRVAGHRKLGEDGDVCFGALGLGEPAPHECHVPAEVADRRIHLGQREP